MNVGYLIGVGVSSGEPALESAVFADSQGPKQVAGGLTTFIIVAGSRWNQAVQNLLKGNSPFHSLPCDVGHVRMAVIIIERRAS